MEVPMNSPVRQLLELIGIATKLALLFQEEPTDDSQQKIQESIAYMQRTLASLQKAFGGE